MKKNLLLVLSLAVCSQFSVAQAYCPTPDEYRAKLNEFQAESLKMISSDNYSNAQAMFESHENYINSIFPACIQYFQNPNTNYDCRKLQTLSTGYLMLDNDEQPAGKTKINNLPAQVQQKCSVEYNTMHFFLDD